MAKVYAYLADGLEGTELLAVVDVLKRGGQEVTLVSVTGSREVVSAHGIRLLADEVIEDTDAAQADVIFLPGGMPGTVNLGNCEALCQALVKAYEEGRRLAAICAAPSVLGKLGLLKGKKATCYPGFEDQLLGAEHTRKGVVTDGTITTSRGLGYALDLGLELVSLLAGGEKALQVKNAIQYDQTEFPVK